MACCGKTNKTTESKILQQFKAAQTSGTKTRSMLQTSQNRFAASTSTDLMLARRKKRSS
jgi:hypothetical protein